MPTKIMNGLDLQSQRIQNVATPVGASDATNKSYVDNISAGLDWKQSVRIGSTGNLSLTGLSVIDGVTPIAGDRILAKDQTTSSANGIYIAAVGAWALATDSSNGNLSSGAVTTVEVGTANSDKCYILTTDGTITPGTTSMVWSIWSAGATYVAGSGLTLTSSTFSVNADATSVIADATSVRINPAYTGLAKRYSINVPAGSTTPAITHGLGTLDVMVQIVEIATGNYVQTDMTATNTSTTTLTFAIAPTAGQFRYIAVA